MAKDCPKVNFLLGSSGTPQAPNFAVFDNDIQVPAYLSGMLAGGISKSNKIGLVGRFSIPGVNRLMNAFIAGARETNPKAEFSISFINSWFDPPKAREAAFAMIDKGADVMYADRFGVSDAAKERKGSPKVDRPPTIRPFAPMAGLPLPVINQQTSVRLLALLLVPAVAWGLMRTPLGLAVRMVGENPAAVEGQGLNVRALPTGPAIAGSALRGALLFAFLMRCNCGCNKPAVLAGPATGCWASKLPYPLYLALPYVMASVALVLLARRAAYPQALMKP